MKKSFLTFLLMLFCLAGFAQQTVTGTLRTFGWCSRSSERFTERYDCRCRWSLLYLGITRTNVINILYWSYPPGNTDKGRREGFDN